ncbi:MAG: YgiQ family radical SAM protein, partial [Atopobiaceae bacterium]|nr:YgiQ family radical SAM protein [Atopobiaceae bacterium]
LISYGMGEKSIVAIADALDAGLDVSDLTYIPGTVYRARTTEQCDKPVMLPTFEQVQADKTEYARSFGTQCRNLNPFLSHPLVEEYPHGVYVIQNPPSEPLSTQEFDAVYELPDARAYHPSYEKDGGIPAIAEIKFSLCSNRGCLGECSFCALNFHQGRIIQTRSDESLIAEAEAMTRDPEFKGYIHDVGGPTANFRVPACQKQLTRGACVGRRCLSPEPCKNLTVTHKAYVRLLRKLRALPGVKKVFVRSGIRFDYALLDSDHTFIRELAEHHVSGQLRLAPEHVCDEVLGVMGKPSNDVYQRFCKEFERVSREVGKEQYVVPYLMSSHPGSTLREAVKLAEFCRDMGYNPEQVQDFYPTPSTVSTCIYYTGLVPRTMKPVYCAVDPHEKAMQRALIQYRNPDNRKLVMEALRKAHRTDLIGYGPKCLVRPDGQKGKSGRKGPSPNRPNEGPGGRKSGRKGPSPNRPNGSNRSDRGRSRPKRAR